MTVRLCCACYENCPEKRRDGGDADFEQIFQGVYVRIDCTETHKVTCFCVANHKIQVCIPDRTSALGISFYQI